MVRKLIAHSLDEALDFIRDGNVIIIAGGTDVMVQRRTPAGLPPRLDKDTLYIANVPELKHIYRDEDGVHIGACTTLDEVEKSELAPILLRKIIHEVASPNIRHFASLAGNIANASPAGDTIVGDVLLDASLKLTSVHGSRLVKAEDFVYGVRHILLQPDELIEEIIFPNQKFDEYKWVKVGSRKADSISKLSFAAAYRIEGDILKECRIAFGSVAIKVMRSHEAEDLMRNIPLSKFEKIIPEIIALYGKVVTPITDQRSNKEYRFQVAMNLCADFLNSIAKGGK